MTDAELTRLAAEKVMMWKCFGLEDSGYSESPNPKCIQNVLGQWIVYGTTPTFEQFDPLADWRAAGAIVEKMRADGWSFRVGQDSGEPLPWAEFGTEQGECAVHHAVIPTAITKAALLAVGAITEADL